MDLQNIQEQLNTEFAKSETRIIFWFDDKGEYEDEVSELQLGDVKLHILDGTNWLYSKYLLNEEDKESKYLVYAAFAKPSDAENPLADIELKSTYNIVTQKRYLLIFCMVLSMHMRRVPIIEILSLRTFYF